MFHKTLALERPTKIPEDWTGPKVTPVSIINYSPGPMNTKMQEVIRTSEYCEKGTKDYFIDLAGGESKIDFSKGEGGKLVNPDDSADKLCGLTVKFDEIEEGKRWKSGDHVDFYD